MAPRPPRQVSNSSLTGAGVIPGLGFCFNKCFYCQSLDKPHTGTVQVPLCLARAGSEGGEPHSPVPQAVPGCGELLQAVPGLGHRQKLLGHEEFCYTSYIQEQGFKKKKSVSGVKALLPCLHPKHLPITAA